MRAVKPPSAKNSGMIWPDPGRGREPRLRLERPGGDDLPVGSEPDADHEQVDHDDEQHARGARQVDDEVALRERGVEVGVGDLRAHGFLFIGVPRV